MANSVLNAAATSSRPRWLGPRLLRRIERVVLYGLLVAFSVLYMIPLAWMVSTSLKEPHKVAIFPVQWIPDPVRWENYAEAWSLFPWGQYTLNSLFIVTAATIGTLVSSTLVAYGFARIRFVGRDKVFFIMLTSIMLPSAVTMIPVYVLFAKLGWINTYNPLTVPAFFGSAYYIFFLRQFMMTLPRELDEAARIDGAGHLTTLTQVILPLIKAPLVAIAVFSIFGNWNDFFGPLLYLNTREKFTFTLALRALQTDVVYGGRYEYLMALALLQILPLLILYFAAQRYFIEGLTLTGVRG